MSNVSKFKKIRNEKNEKRKRESRQSERKEREEKSTERNFSLKSTEIGPWVFVGGRGKVSPRNEGYAWVPKSRGFVKLQEVWNFPTWVISSLKVI